MSTKTILHLLFLAFWLAPCASAQDENTPATSSLVVLRNGRTLSGTAHYQGDHYLIRLAAGGEISLKQDEIEFVCRDVAEAYVFKHRKLAPKSAGQHLDLAEWCLRNSLYSQAATELMDAMTLDPRNKRLARVERRLTHAVRPPMARPTATAGMSHAVSMREIEESVGQLQLAAIKKFRTHVQPLLLNRCYSCHGLSAKNEFRLFRPLKGRDVTRRTTQRNIYTAIKMIDRENPALSSLLTMPVGPHGGSNAILTPRNQEQITLLKNWVNMIARQKKPAQPYTIQRPDLSLLQNKGNHSTAEKKRTSSSSRPPVDATKGDPFDPAAFNRIYASERENAPSANAARN